MEIVSKLSSFSILSFNLLFHPVHLFMINPILQLNKEIIIIDNNNDNR